MRTSATLFVLLAMVTACSTPTSLPETSFPLKAYIETEDPAFNYKIIDTLQGENWKEIRIRMISGTWLTDQEVSTPEWWHWLNVIVPDKVTETESMMIIGGGSIHDSVPIHLDDWAIQAAVATGSIISHVSNIPFQPIDFKGDEKEGRYEDDLIAYGWRQYLESGASEEEQEWLARFPMTRAVVRAMDVVQEISQQTTPVDSFFVTGASKRGWTTWTTAAADERVMGMAPIVIDLLNIVPSFKHHWQCYGEWSPAVQNYVNEGIMNWMFTEAFQRLLETVGPYSFRDQLTLPKLLINGTCDEFFVTDSWKFYWDDLKGPNYLQYVPNGNHGLRGTYQPISLVSFYHATITDTRIPEIHWHISGDSIYFQTDPESDYIIRQWEAINPKDRDFRIYVVGEAWHMQTLELTPDGRYAIHITAPESGFKAALLEVVFNPTSEFPLTFTSGTVVTPDRYPFEPFVPEVLP